MKSVFNTSSFLNTLLGRTEAQEKLTPVVSETVQVPNKTWLDWEAEILLNAQYNHQILSVHMEDQPENMQTVLLEMDLFASELLVDSIYPLSLPKLTDVKRNRQSIWLQVRYGKGYYRLETHIHELLPKTSGTLISLKIDNAYFTDSRRWNPRIHFATRQGPSVEIYPAHQPRIKGWLSNLSNQGCMIETYGQKDRPDFSGQNQVRCDFQFNEHFELSVSAKILQSNYFRQPCCFSKTRLLFNRLSHVEREQINTFIDMYSQADKFLNSAA
ncbi:hypothetical protein [Teredinibacter sp. KSP-S5-2]|uniref:hypothetical protein n=1 Tax=Teredinibacter sp. KSP-S5-2 TaxID=3034506 RepID=UPI0029346EF7|nr:hypothetical protein [Teredinibacter sp. KSP-S5-2]WNO07992.1 hypothetical protein P5V12_13495 [Teredinibacter sp. KSP-S5-2]